MKYHHSKIIDTYAVFMTPISVPRVELGAAPDALLTAMVACFVDQLKSFAMAAVSRTQIRGPVAEFVAYCRSFSLLMKHPRK